MSKRELIRQIEMILIFLKTGRPDDARHFLEGVIDDLNGRKHKRQIEELPWHLGGYRREPVTPTSDDRTAELMGPRAFA
jgi:hypothetical protein